MKNKKGFTLIELLIVIAVIAILVAIVIPNFRGIRIQAKQSAAMADLRNLQTACMVYMKFHNVYPTTLSVLPNEGIDKRIVNKIPDDPFSEGNEYLYDYFGTGENTTFVIWSVGPDGTDNIVSCGDDAIGPVGDDIYVTDAKTVTP
ncbi:MAG: prepilin-type N-terminal cleavage/methylation domain-containing protein [Candidatus Contubernalis sp.]|nr:prepilin-type N-terminal cleavage/methylation domain-containing protein [Candidatus Contubernalis sp.]